MTTKEAIYISPRMGLSSRVQQKPLVTRQLLRSGYKNVIP